MHIISFSLAVSFLAPFVLAVPDRSAKVIVRIEGESETIFEGPVITRGGIVTTQSGISHHCDGTNFGAHYSPGPTATSALASAAGQNSFTWDGIFSDKNDDFSITSIGGESPMGNQSWKFLVNYLSCQAYGCRARVEFLDEVLWTSNTDDESSFLKLSGNCDLANINQTVQLTITDGLTREPVAGAHLRSVMGADVGNQTSDENGHVSVNFTTAGRVSLKAEKEGSVRSNRFDLHILPETSMGSVEDPQEVMLGD